MDDLIIRSSANEKDIYDVIIYLATSENVSDRICFKRLKAKDLLESNNRTFDIETFLLEEDKSLD